MRKLTLEYIKDYIKRFEYTCLSKEYKNNFSKLEVKCPKRHIYKVSWSDFKQGYRCSKCFYDKSRKSLEEIREHVEQFGYICLSKEYKNVKSKLEIRCPVGHTYKTRWDSFQQGIRCPECWKIDICGPGSPAWKGGIAAEPYCDAWLDRDYKQSIKDRDGNICLDPCCSKNSKRLAIHHIDYKKKNCHPLNLITICNSCNSFANKDRKWHTAWYQAIIYRRYINASQ